MTYGYIRVSTREQNEDRQLIALSTFDIPGKNLFLDKQSGKDFNRPAYQLLSYVAQSERENIRQRQREGIAAAKARGVVFGAERKKVPDDFDEWFHRWRRREITSSQMAEHCGVHVTTVYRWARERGLPFQSIRGRYSYKSTEA